MTDPAQASEQDPPNDPGFTTIRKPVKGMESLRLREVWEYRELLQLLVWRNILVRYKQSVVGIGWAVFRPMMSVGIFSVIFGHFLKVDSDSLPYPIFALVALLPWQYFASSLGGTSSGLTGGASLATKVYFPRLILPLSSLFTGLIDFAITFAIAGIMMVWYRDSISLTWGVACLPVFLFLTMLTAFAVGLWLSAAMVAYRDVQHALPFLIRCWFYLTPIVYSASAVPSKLRFVYSLNPMVGVIEGFRWALLGKGAPDWGAIALSASVTVVIMIGGLYYFRRTERTFADIV